MAGFPELGTTLTETFPGDARDFTQAGQDKVLQNVTGMFVSYGQEPPNPQRGTQ